MFIHLATRPKVSASANKRFKLHSMNALKNLLKVVCARNKLQITILVSYWLLHQVFRTLSI